MDIGDHLILFIAVDELAAFDFDDLPGVLERGRKYGLTACAGIQNISQLKQKYGEHGATTLLSCFRTKLIFNPGDSETAKSMAEEIGKEVIDRTVGSSSDSNGRITTTKSRQRDERYAVMPEELMQLRDLDAYLKLVGDFPTAKLRIPIS